MLRLKPFVSKKIWGYENWCVSTHPAGLSFTENEQTLKDILGKDFPLIVKVIQADQTLSVQAHPDDAYAKIHENTRGKFECWYILESANAHLVAGIKLGLSKEDIRAALAQNTIENALNTVCVEKGDFMAIPPGMVHAIGGGIRLLEVQQSSDITYRLYDWGRARELHIEKAFDVLQAHSAAIIPRFEGIFTSPYFSLERINIDGEKKIECGENTALFVLEGNGAITDAHGKPVLAHTEDTFFFTVRETIIVKGAASILKILPASCQSSTGTPASSM